MKLTLAEYYNHCDAYDGYCPDCDDITRDGSTEPDVMPAHQHGEYRCPDCDGANIHGMESAVIVGRIEVVANYEFGGWHENDHS